MPSDEVWASMMRRALAERAANPRRLPKRAQCGTADRYAAGLCRCESCTRAHAVAKRERRAARRAEQKQKAAEILAVIESHGGAGSDELRDLIEEQLSDMRRGDYAPKWDVYLDAPLPSGTSSLHDRIAPQPRHLLEWWDPTFEEATR